MKAMPHLCAGSFLAVALVLGAPGRAGADVVLDVNDGQNLKLRFEKIPVLIQDTASKVTLDLDLAFPGAGGPWRGIEFESLPVAGTGYRASVVAVDGQRIAVADFALTEAGFDPLARLPISGEPVLAQVWGPVEGVLPGDGGTEGLAYVWEVNQSVGAGFGLFGSLEARVVPEPGVVALALMGAAVGGICRMMHRRAGCARGGQKQPDAGTAG